MKEMKPGFFSVMLSDRNKGNGHKVKNSRLLLNIWKKFFTMRVTERWHRLWSLQPWRYLKAI